jgi:dTDP-4-dehydrorhamnose reductase
MQVLITGGKGQLGRLVAEQFLQGGNGVDSTDLPELDITRQEAVDRMVDTKAPDLVVNCSAYTAVDQAESDREAAYAVNRDGPAVLAAACDAAGVPLIHISTDYVFDGSLDRPYRESDPVRPTGVYGASKAEGETAVRRGTARHIILRTAWLYAAQGKNFVHTMLSAAAKGIPLRVVADQRGCPTAAEDLAHAIAAIGKRVVVSPGVWGTYHYCGTGITTWYDFAAAIFASARRWRKELTPELVPIPTSDYPTPARRPPYSALDCSAIRRAFGIVAPPWQESLDRVIDSIMAEKAPSS